MRHDLVVGLLAYKDRESEQRRCEGTLACFRSALEKEMVWHLDHDPLQYAYYAGLMYETGFWREATKCIDKIIDELPGRQDLREHNEEMKEVLDALDAKRDCQIQARIQQMPTIMCEFGQRCNYDDLIREANPEFWREIMEDFQGTAPQQLHRELFPEEGVL